MVGETSPFHSKWPGKAQHLFPCVTPESSTLSPVKVNLILVLVVLVFPASVLCQQTKSTWKEYRSAADGFALTVPALPTPHDSPAFPGATAYAIPLKGLDSGVVLRVKKDAADCSSVITRLEERMREKSSEADPSSVRNLSIEGHPGIEYRWRKSSSYTILERWYCVDGRLYVFSVNWPSAQPFPIEATIILDSFRLLPKEQPSR